MTEYPEHEKLKAVQDASQVIGEFIEFGGYTLCKFREAGSNGEPEYVWTALALAAKPVRHEYAPRMNDYLAGYAEANPAHESWPSGYVPVGRPINEILADYFEIDLDKVEAEKRAMLDSIRASQGLR